MKTPPFKEGDTIYVTKMDGTGGKVNAMVRLVLFPNSYVEHRKKRERE